MNAATYYRQVTRRALAPRPLSQSAIKIPHYKPVNQKAKDFHASQAKINILPGGNQSGKTTTVAHDHVMYARKQPKGCKGLAMTDTYENIADNLWPHYKECMHESEWEWIKGNQKTDNPKIIRLKKNWYDFHFGSYEQGRKAQQGKKWDYFHPDEECPYEIWLEVYRGCLARGARIGYSYTPLEGYEYLEELIEKGTDPTNTWYWAPQEPMSLLENPHVPQAEKDAWIDMLSEQGQQTRVFGYKGKREGLVYPQFSKEKHVIEPFPIPYDWRFYRCIDFGKVHPTVSLILATDGEKIFIVDEYYQASRLIEYHVKQFQEQHKRIPIKDRPFENWLPPLITITDHDAQLRLEYEAQGIFSEPAQKRVIAGIEVVQNLLSNIQLGVFAGCKYTIREFGRYVYPGADKQGYLKPGEKGENPEKKDDHCLDPARYGCVQEFGYVTWNPENIPGGTIEV